MPRILHAVGKKSWARFRTLPKDQKACLELTSSSYQLIKVSSKVPHVPANSRKATTGRSHPTSQPLTDSHLCSVAKDSSGILRRLSTTPSLLWSLDWTAPLETHESVCLSTQARFWGSCAVIGNVPPELVIACNPSRAPFGRTASGNTGFRTGSVLDRTCLQRGQWHHRGLEWRSRKT